MGVRGNADYSASKAGLHGLVLSLAPDVATVYPGARVNVIAPGPVHTPQFDKECAEDARARWIESEATVALKKPVDMEALARTCLFLGSDRYSGSTTGQIISVNGGKSGKLFYFPDGTPC